MKHSGWISLVVVVQLLYALLLILVPVYLLLMAYGWGAVILSAVLGGPGIVALVGWFGLRKGKFWGWSIALFADVAMFGILIYCLMDYGWHNIDWEVVALTLLTAGVLAALLTPAVRAAYWQRVGAQTVLSS